MLLDWKSPDGVVVVTFEQWLERQPDWVKERVARECNCAAHRAEREREEDA